MAYFFFFLLLLSTAASPPPSLPPLPFQSHPPRLPSQQLPTPSFLIPSPPPMQTIIPSLKPSPPPIQPPPPPIQPHSLSSPPPPPEMPQERMKNILEALIGSGDFANWGNLLTTADPSLLPFTSTLFVPNNDVVSSNVPSSSVGGGIDPFLFLYHIVPHRLTFTDLCLFTAPNTRLPTLLPTKSILITNSSRVNFTIDGARITDPDLYSTDSVAVHGIGGILDYQIYGGDGGIESFPWMDGQNQAPPPMMKGVGVPMLIQSSKGGILRSGFAAFIYLSLGLMML